MPPEGLAGFFETAQYLVGQGETTKNVFRLDRTPGHHTIAVEPRLPQGNGAGCGVSRGDRTQPPPAGHIGWGLMDGTNIPAHSPHPSLPAWASRPAGPKPGTGRGPTGPVSGFSLSQAGGKRGKTIGAHQAAIKKLPEGGAGCCRVAHLVHQAVEEETTARAAGHHVVYATGRGAQRGRLHFHGDEIGGVFGGQKQYPWVIGSGKSGAHNANVTIVTKLLQICWVIVAHPARQDEGFPSAGGQSHACQLLTHRINFVSTIQAIVARLTRSFYWRNAMPVDEEPGIGAVAHRLGLGAGGGQ